MRGRSDRRAATEQLARGVSESAGASREPVAGWGEWDRTGVLGRREWLGTVGRGILAVGPLAGIIGTPGCGYGANQVAEEELFVTRDLTPPGSFTRGAEGPGVDRDGILYAVNFQRQGTIGRVMPDGTADVFVELADGSIANGIRFNSRGQMFVADYTNHNVLRIDPATRAIAVHAHQPEMSQPNDLAIGANDIIYASDPAWSENTGRIWRVDLDGSTTVLETMGTTNGIEVGADERTLYVNESNQRNVWAYDLSPTGEISNKRLLIRFEAGGMDGMRCDVDGNLYITRYGTGTIAVVSPSGELMREVPLASGGNVTNIAFGGPDGRTVYLTVADTGNIQTFRNDRPGREWQLSQRPRSA